MSAGSAAWIRASGAKTFAPVDGPQLAGRVVGEGRLRAGAKPAGVVHHQMKRPGIDRGAEQCRTMPWVGDVSGQRDQPRGVQRASRAFEFADMASVTDDGPAVVEQSGGHRSAESARRAGDDSDGRGVVISRHTRILVVNVNFKSTVSEVDHIVDSGDLLTISDVVHRSGFPASALRFYEKEGLITATRTAGGQRRFERQVLRRLAFIRAARNVGLSLDEVGAALAKLPDGRTPTRADWARLSTGWRARIDDQIAGMMALPNNLQSCIGCGCLSLKRCAISNPADTAAVAGPGAVYLPKSLRRPVGRG